MPLSTVEDTISPQERMPEQERIIRDKQVINLFTHEKKVDLLERLRHQSKTIMMLSEETGMNPGTVKRHLIDLEQGGLIMISKAEKNKFKVNMVYYRITAMKFIILWEWPADSQRST